MIDIPTYMLAIGIGNLAFAVLMAAYMRGTTLTPGLRIWMWARLVFSATQLLAWARPDGAMPLLAVTELAGWAVALSLEIAAYATFFGYPQLRRYLVFAAGFGVLLACASPLAGFTHSQMIAGVSTAMGVGAFFVGAVLLHPRLAGATSLQRLIGGNDLVFGVVLALWGVVDMRDTGSAPLLQGLAYVAGYMLLIVHGFGFLLMSKERDDARMERLATTDDLTGLLNRRAFFAQADRARLLALRQAQPIALLMLDIDHFKQINDRFGHAAGDEALLKFSTICSETLRGHDILGRLGGEEFALVLPGTDLAGAQGAAERLRHEVMETGLLACGERYTMTVSIGLVVIDPQEDLPSALARADHALYQAKHAGRNRVQADTGQRRA